MPRRPAPSPSLDQLRRLDARLLARKCAFEPGNGVRVRWSGADPLHVIGDEGSVILFDGRLPQRIFSTFTYPTFGGRMPWFVCPACARRVRILYDYGGFRCRHCVGLLYETQRVDRPHRGLLRARNIRVRLGGTMDLTEPMPLRPRYMRKARYKRLLVMAIDREMRWLGGLEKRFVRKRPLHRPSTHK
jgi:hypothetical protein